MDNVKTLRKYSMPKTTHNEIVKFEYGGLGYKRKKHYRSRFGLLL